MKILRITLRNLASLAGTQTVDFTREPLRTAGLFSISGPTGSGKSTLLDALCLALYDDTPRLRGIGRLAELANGERQNDPRNLLRRGAAEGLAEVVFRGLDGESYTARWSVRRARSRVEGTLQPTEMALFRGNVPAPANGDTVCSGKKTEVLQAIEARLGLTFAQFTRAVLLAQNDFATFLKADDKERAGILQALTGTERFEEISIAVFARSNTEKEAVAAIEAKLSGCAPMNADDRVAAEAASAQAEAGWKEAAEKLHAREAHAAWFTRLAELWAAVFRSETTWREVVAAREAAAPRRLELEHTAEVSGAARSLRDAEIRAHEDAAAAEKSREEATRAQVTAQADLETKKVQRDKAEVASAAAKVSLESAQPLLRQARELDAKLAPLSERLARVVREREGADSAVKAVGERRHKLLEKRELAETERSDLKTKLAALAIVAAFAPDTRAWLDRLDRAAQSRQSLDEAGCELSRKTQDEETRKQAFAAERASEPELRASLATALSSLEAAEQAAQAYDAEQIAKARQEAEATREALRELEQALRELGELARQQKSGQADLVKLRGDNEADGRLLAELKERRGPAVETEFAAARHACELAEAAITDEAARLREKLRADEPCPVCGALEHPYAAHSPAAEAVAVRALREDLSRKETALADLRKQWAGLEVMVRNRAEQESEKQRALDALAPRFAALRARRHEHPAARAIVALPEDESAPALERALAATKETLQKLEAAEAARRATEKQRETCRAAHAQAAKALERLEKSLAAHVTELARLQTARESAAAAVRKLELAHHAGLTELNPLLAAYASAVTAWENDPAAFRQRFAEQTASLLDLEKRDGELGTILRETQAELLPVVEQFTAAEAVLVARRSEEGEVRTACDALREQRKSLFANRAADDVENELRNSFQRAEETRVAVEKELAEADKRLASRAEAWKAAGEAVAAAHQRLLAASIVLTDWLAAFAARSGRALDRDALEVLLARDDAWMKAERAALEAVDGEVRNSEGALAVYRKTHEHHLAQRPTPDDEATVAAELVPLRSAGAAAEQRRDAARLTLAADDQRRAACLQLTSELEMRRAAAEPWLKLNELIGSADGAKFRGIAQRRTLDLLLGYANAQLEQLAARYRLERLRESLNLIVLDRDMGDERRSVHSLSGGESFLVSLALALALASLTSNRLRIESLFIDEGFGSLDPETLNVAMNALMHLEAQGRKVGVISHVSEMADAIPVQIRVTKGRSGASRLIVPGAPRVESDAADCENSPPAG